MVELYFGQNSVLAAAHSRVNGETIFVEECGEIEYFHILFDRHELVQSEGTWSESFYPEARLVNQQDSEKRREILELFPDLLSTADSYGSTARICLRPYEGQLMAQYLALQNDCRAAA